MSAPSSPTNEHGAAVETDGSLWVWGGYGGGGDFTSLPLATRSQLRGVRAIVNGQSESDFALSTFADATGEPTFTPTPTNTPIVGATPPTPVTVVPADVRAWGRDGIGQLGVQLFTECDAVTGEPCSPEPLDVSGIDVGVIAIGAGDFYSVALVCRRERLDVGGQPIWSTRRWDDDTAYPASPSTWPVWRARRISGRRTRRRAPAGWHGLGLG